MPKFRSVHLASFDAFPANSAARFLQRKLREQHATPRLQKEGATVLLQLADIDRRIGELAKGETV